MNSKSKRQEGVDRISELPNALLCHILSFLPILDAVHTTILSRRWKNLWTSLPELEFDDEGFNHSWTELNRFMMFVDRVLFLHDSTDIKKFSFKLSRHRQRCRGPTLEHFIHIYRWICTALRRNVVELDLDLLDYDCKRFELPQSLFLCKTLEILKALYLPTFENLIQLELILRDCNYWEFLTGFLNNCPVLKHFVFQNNGNTWYKEEHERRWNSGYNPPDIVPLCLLSHLETISIREFKGQRDEMEVAKYLLKNGEVLSRMTTYTRTSPRTGKFLCSEDEMYRKFSTFEKGSKKCQVEFVKNVRY